MELATFDHGPAEEWMAIGACRTANPDLFFQKAYDPETRTAKAYCAVCPVQGTCLAYAVARPNLEGVWGGTHDEERHKLRGVRKRYRTLN